MKLDNGILHLELDNKGGEMSSLVYNGFDVLYKGDGPYWTGKNPTLFPMISSPDSKQYELDGNIFPCRNHGLIRYSTLETFKADGDEVTMKLESSKDTLKEYPFNFEYFITYKLDNNKVLISYKIINKDNKTMPFTFGLHPGFIVRNFDEMKLIFEDDKKGELFNQNNQTSKMVDLGTYTNFLNDLSELQTVIFKNLKSKYVLLQMKEYSVKVDISKYKYLALWTKDPKANYMCIEPWLSINDIRNAKNPFDSKFELEYLQPNEEFNIDYSIEII